MPQSLSTQPYKGSRDFYPEDQRLQRYLFAVWSKVAERYGYEQYNGPMLELTDLYRAKSGEEIVDEQTYSFEDRGGRDVTIRPEMTPTVARMVAARWQELTYPLRWYSIPNLWRYERPQHGRMREHWQLNVDIFGIDSMEADLEVIMLANDIMRAFGAKPEMYSIKINSRNLVGLLLGDYLKLDIAAAAKLTKLLDRRTKISEEVFANQIQMIVGDESHKVQDMLNIKEFDQLPAVVVESGVVEELRKLCERLRNAGVSNVEFDLTLMRGFDYYTGIVFEITDTNPDNPRSIFGGGRYDELVKVFDVQRIPAVGFGCGDVRLADFLRTHDLLPNLKSTTQIYIAALAEELIPKTQQIATDLRKQGVRAVVDLTVRKAGLQIKTALKKQVPYILFVGEEEVASGKYTLKNLETEQESKLSLEEVANTFKA